MDAISTVSGKKKDAWLLGYMQLVSIQLAAWAGLETWAAALKKTGKILLAQGPPEKIKEEEQKSCGVGTKKVLRVLLRVAATTTRWFSWSPELQENRGGAGHDCLVILPLLIRRECVKTYTAGGGYKPHRRVLHFTGRIGMGLDFAQMYNMEEDTYPIVIAPASW